MIPCMISLDTGLLACCDGGIASRCWVRQLLRWKRQNSIPGPWLASGRVAAWVWVLARPGVVVGSGYDTLSCWHRRHGHWLPRRECQDSIPGPSWASGRVVARAWVLPLPGVVVVRSYDMLSPAGTRVGCLGGPPAHRHGMRLRCHGGVASHVLVIWHCALVHNATGSSLGGQPAPPHWLVVACCRHGGIVSL